MIVLQTGGAETGYPVFQDQFLGGAAIFAGTEQLVLAGNDSPGDPAVRVAVMNTDMEVLSNQLYPDVQMEVASVSSLDGEICVLGSTGFPGGKGM